VLHQKLCLNHVTNAITKLLKTSKVFEWIEKCQNACEDIKNQCVQAPILISLNWELEFHYTHMHLS
jgi:hypothetical protein